MNELRELARKFLAVADEKHELVSAYFDGSSRAECYQAYKEVINAEGEFLKVYNELFDDNIECSLHYDIAEMYE